MKFKQLRSALRLSAFLTIPCIASAQGFAPVTLPVNSPAFVFSPGNWTGDAARGGSSYRQTWYPGAYFRVAWTTTNAEPTAEIVFDVQGYGDKIKNPPELTYCMDGVWTNGVSCAERIKINNLKGAGAHALVVYFKSSEQTERWGSAKDSGLNVLRVKGLELDSGSTPVATAPAKHWALIVGDSITEGSAADFGKSDNLAAWSYFVGVGLQSLGYEYGVSACGYSGWIRPGDRGGDVPPYYMVSKSQNGMGGIYEDNRSRWNKIDGAHSLLDTLNHLSAYGEIGQEPSVILINFATNDVLSNVNSSDLQASITQSLQALQRAAPEALIVVVVPFGQYGVVELRAGVEDCLRANPNGNKIFLIDLGKSVAAGLAANGFWSGLHPNMRGHATFAAEILAHTVKYLPSDSGRK